MLPRGNPVNLWRVPYEILTVRNRQTGQIYAYGTDWSTNTSGQLTFPAGSAVPMVAADFPYHANPAADPIWQPFTKSCGPLFISSTYQEHQIAVTYRPSVQGPLLPQLGTIPVAAAKIAGRNPISVTFYGDSITTGADSTDVMGIAPHQPGWVDLLAAMLSNGGDGAYHWRNVSEAGWTSGTAADNVDGHVNTTASDLVVLAFGMNDAAGAVPAATFESNLRAMISNIRSHAPATEFLLVAPWLGNDEWRPMDNQRLLGYRTAMIHIGGDTAGVAVADMTTMASSVLATKNYYDVTSNGVNHPVDFMHVAYAQVVARAIR